MRNLALFLLFLTMFAVTLSREIHKRYANQYDEGALLEAFVRAVEEGNIDSNLVEDKRRDMKKRWWFKGRPRSE